MDHHWHADETRWPMFVTDICGRRWYMWVFRSPSAAVYILDPSRSSVVPESFFGELAKGIISADRYCAYKVLLKDGRILIAFCWAHVRRDFLSLAQQWPKEEDWGFSWVEKIGELYHLNDLRLEHAEDSPRFAEADARLSLAMDGMKQSYENELADDKLHPAKKKVLTSLKKHWSGLSLFVEHPWLPMDNSEAERKLRLLAVGRKNYYGSGSVWSGFLMAAMQTILQTLLIWNINPHLWLTDYLTACAKNGGHAPADFESFLPWNMSPETLSSLRMKAQEADHPLLKPERDTS
jgi:transposase